MLLIRLLYMIPFIILTACSEPEPVRPETPPPTQTVINNLDAVRELLPAITFGKYSGADGLFSLDEETANFNQNGTGTYRSRTGQTSRFSWSLNDGKVTIVGNAALNGEYQLIHSDGGGPAHRLVSDTALLLELSRDQAAIMRARQKPEFNPGVFVLAVYAGSIYEYWKSDRYDEANASAFLDGKKQVFQVIDGLRGNYQSLSRCWRSTKC